MASTTQTAKYPRQVIVLLDHETADRIESIAETRGETKSAVVRELIATGLEVAK